MKIRAFSVILGLIIGFGLITHLYAIKNNNLFFTVDQGRDAVYVREILENQKLFLKGPETSIKGIFVGPLWYYFVSLGYFLAGGHPVGGVWVLIVLNLLATFVLAFVLAKKISPTLGLIVALGLTFFWPFFVTSLWSFNPFPIAALSIFLILLLIEVLKTRKKSSFFAAGIIILFAFNTNLASAFALTIFYLVTGFIIYYKRGFFSKLSFSRRFIFLVLELLLVSFFFFALNPEHFRDWQVVYLPPLVFIAVILWLWQLPKKLKIPLILVILIVNFWYFSQKYQAYLEVSDNPSLLYNQLSVIDSLYQESRSQGFAAYNYTDTFYDYPYQYLFWWYGKQKYGYLPCEYANYPLSPKELYIPGYNLYLEPKRDCDRLKFLIIQSKTNGQDNYSWPERFRAFHQLEKTIQVGQIRLEEYLKKPSIPNDYCIWWQRCD